MKSLYTVIFEDGSNYLGGNYQNTGWMDIPNKPIKRIIYSLPNGDNLVLNGYDEYFHYIEVTQNIMGKNSGKMRLESANILGLKNNIVTSYKIALFQNSEHKIGEIKKEIFNKNDKKIKQLNPSGWK